MSQQIESLKERRTQLILQRSQGKDIIEQSERELGAVGFAIQQLEAAEKAAAEAAEAAEAAKEDNSEVPEKL